MAVNVYETIWSVSLFIIRQRIVSWDHNLSFAREKGYVIYLGTETNNVTDEIINSVCH